MSRKIYYATIILFESSAVMFLVVRTGMPAFVSFLCLIALQAVWIYVSIPQSLVIDEEKLVFAKKLFRKERRMSWGEVHLFEMKERRFTEPVVWLVFFVIGGYSALVISDNEVLHAGWIIASVIAVAVILFSAGKRMNMDILLKGGELFRIKGYYYPEREEIFAIIEERAASDAEMAGAEFIDYDRFPPLG